MLTRLKSAVEIATNVALAAAAVTLAWRLLYAPAMPRAGEARAAIENVESQGLLIALSAANRKGAPDAEVVLLEFSDYQCPYCGKYANETFGEIDKAFVATALCSVREATERNPGRRMTTARPKLGVGPGAPHHPGRLSMGDRVS